MKAKEIEGVSYEVMDFLNIKYETSTFDYVLDKGSFDALCCDKFPETVEKVKLYLFEILRVLSGTGGKYVCVSLLQDFVFEALLDNLLAQGSFEVRLYKLDKLSKGEKSFQPFMLSFERVEGETKLLLKETLDGDFKE